MKTQSKNLAPQGADAFGRELDMLRQEVVADLGERDVAHIRQIIRTANRSEAAGRVLLHFGFDPVSFVLGTTALGLSKILENMEIGHNIMHGQYDWTGDPALDSHRYEWDNVCTGFDWRHSHNFEHHTFTNILGKDRDVGYSLLRVTPEQAWRPRHLVQPVSAGALALLFQWGVGAHDLRVEEVTRGEQTPAELGKRALPFATKAGWQLFKDYVFFPALALGNAPRVFLGNLFANGIRNVWAFAVIFCGHFPEGVRVYDEAETEHESRRESLVPCPHRSPEPPDRAPPLPGHSRLSLPGDGAARAGDLCALWTSLQHGQLSAPTEQRHRSHRAPLATRTEGCGAGDRCGAGRSRGGERPIH
jgi:fatty acid desaturase